MFYVLNVLDFSKDLQLFWCMEVIVCPSRTSKRVFPQRFFDSMSGRVYKHWGFDDEELGVNFQLTPISTLDLQAFHLNP